MSAATDPAPDAAPVLGFERFAAAVLDELDIEVGFPVAATTDLYDEIGLDSLQAMELLLVVEGWSGRTDHLDDLPVVFTMGDAYAHYLAVAVGSQAARVDS